MALAQEAGDPSVAKSARSGGRRSFCRKWRSIRRQKAWRTVCTVRQLDEGRYYRFIYGMAFEQALSADEMVVLFTFIGAHQVAFPLQVAGMVTMRWMVPFDQ
jgi:hypothetical protein